MRIVKCFQNQVRCGIDNFYVVLNNDLDMVTARKFVWMSQNRFYHKNVYQFAYSVDIAEFLLDITIFLWNLLTFRNIYAVFLICHYQRGCK